MAIYDPIVPRPRDGSRRDSGDMPDALQRALYQEMLSEELGRRPEGFAPAEPEGEWRDLMPAIIAMIFLALLVLAIAYVVMLWRSGEFEGWGGGATVTAAERAWRRADRARPLEETAPAESEVEAMLAGPPKAPLEAEDEEPAIEE